MAISGIFKPTNKTKYRAKRLPVYRSLWERKVMTYLDTHPDVIEWKSEVPIPYTSPIDNRTHRYYVDFFVVLKDESGKIRTELWEVKPLSQTKPPKATKIKGKPTKRYMTEAVTYMINEAKWQAAEKICAVKGWEFRVLTERNIFGK